MHLIAAFEAPVDYPKITPCVIVAYDDGTQSVTSLLECLFVADVVMSDVSEALVNITAHCTSNAICAGLHRQGDIYLRTEVCWMQSIIPKLTKTPADASSCIPGCKSPEGFKYSTAAQEDPCKLTVCGPCLIRDCKLGRHSSTIAADHSRAAA